MVNNVMRQFKNQMNKTTKVNEGLLGRILHNAKLRIFFKETFIKGWKSPDASKGQSKFNWEKTATNPGNQNVAWNTLQELKTYYATVPKDVKGLQKAQGGVFASIFSGFWTKVFQRIMGNPTKLETLAKFNASMSVQIDRLFNALDRFYKQMDIQKQQAAVTT